MDTLYESTFHFGYEEEVNASSRGWFIPCDYPGESVSLSASFFQNRGFNTLQNQRELEAMLGTSVDTIRAVSTRENIAITSSLKSVRKVLQDLRLAFESCPTNKDQVWFRFSIKTTSKLMRFLGKVLAKSAFSKKFAIDDLYNSVYFCEDTNQFVLMVGDDIRFTDARFDAMVKDVTSFMVLFANHSADENRKPEGTETFDCDVVESYKSYRNFLQSGDCKNYDARAAYNFPLFWDLDDKLEGFALGSLQQFEHDKDAYEMHILDYIGPSWAEIFGKIEPAGTQGTDVSASANTQGTDVSASANTQGTDVSASANTQETNVSASANTEESNFSVLKKMYDTAMGRKHRPNYKTAGSVTVFFRNSVEHSLIFTAPHQQHRERMVWAFEEVLQIWWKMFMWNLDYVEAILKNEFARNNFLAKLRFRF